MIPKEIFDPNAHPVLDANGYWVAMTFLRCLTRTRAKVLLHPSHCNDLGQRILLQLTDIYLGDKAKPFRYLAPVWLERLETMECPGHPDWRRAEAEIRSLWRLTEAELMLARAIVIFQSHARCGDLLKHGSVPDRLQLDRDRILTAVIGHPISEMGLDIDGPSAKGVIVRWPPKLLEVSVSSTVWTLYRTPGLTAQELNARLYKSVSPGSLTLSDFPHLDNEIAVALGLLRADPSVGGLNLLVHGPPGHGKTELAGLLVRAAGFFPERIVDAPSLELIRSYKNHGRGVLIIDEADSLLRRDQVTDGTFPKKPEINDLLELPGRPCLWIVNDLGGMEASFLRRFGVVIEPSDPSGGVIKRLLERQLPGAAEVLTDLAISEAVSPAVIQRYADAVGMSEAENAETWKSRFAAVMGQYEHAMQFPRIAGRGLRRERRPPAASESMFVPGHSSADYDLKALLVPAESPARLLLHGPPGTGKTTFVAALADAQGLALLTKGPSDLLSPYKGEAEQRIAAAFREADARGAMLFLDEVEGILHGRDRAHRSWEVTQVNELLLQIDRFSGWLVAATNVLDRVDAAALRRFDLKIGFKAPDKEEREAMVRDWMLRLGVTIDAGCVATLRAMDGVVMGDLACVERRLRFLREPVSASRLVDLLAQELAYRNGGTPRQPFGFSGGRMAESHGKH